MSEFIEAINDHRNPQFIPSERVCVDEIMTQWYGFGGDQIDFVLPHYVAMERKPENKRELKVSACVASGIVLRIENFLSAEKTRSWNY